MTPGQPAPTANAALAAFERLYYTPLFVRIRSSTDYLKLGIFIRKQP